MKASGWQRFVFCIGLELMLREGWHALTKSLSIGVELRLVQVVPEIDEYKIYHAPQLWTQKL